MPGAWRAHGPAPKRLQLRNPSRGRHDEPFVRAGALQSERVDLAVVVVSVVPLALVDADIHEILSLDQFQSVDLQPKGALGLEAMLRAGPASAIGHNHLALLPYDLHLKPGGFDGAVEDVVDLHDQAVTRLERVHLRSESVEQTHPGDLGFE